MYARGKPCEFTKHAHEEMHAERPPIDLDDVAWALEEPDSDDGHCATRRIRNRTILVYYEEREDEIYVRSVSATRTRLPA